MEAAIVAAIITGALSLIGVIISNLATAKQTDKSFQKSLSESIGQTETKLDIMEERITELTREVREHNDFARRVPVLEEKLKSANHRITNLERERSDNR